MPSTVVSKLSTVRHQLTRPECSLYLHVQPMGLILEEVGLKNCYHGHRVVPYLRPSTKRLHITQRRPGRPLKEPRRRGWTC